MTAQPKTIQELGLGTFEQAPAAGPTEDYTEYWRTYATDYLPQLDHRPVADELSNYYQMAKFVGHVSECVIGGHELSGLIDFSPKFWYNSTRHYGRVLMTWDDRYGHFNRAPEAKADLLEAASLVLQENAGLTDGWLSEFSSVLKPAKRSLWGILERYPVAEQDNGIELLLAGQLIHKAGWLALEEAEQQSLFRVAENIYDQITDGPISKNSIMASGYLQDLLFYQVHQSYRQHALEGDRREQTAATLAMRLLISEAATEVVKLCNAYDHGRGDRQATKGLILEHFVPLLLRDTIVTDIERGDSWPTDFFTVRHAFNHEDMSPSAKTIRPGFDLVVQRYSDGREVETTPLQLKFESRNGAGRLADRGKMSYLPGIVVIKADRMSTRDVAEAAEALQTKHRTGSRADVVRKIDRVQDFRDNLMKKVI